MRETGYFDVSSEKKPLLHLWSLGIEKQYYVLWPVFLSVISRLTRNHQIMTLLVITLSSLAISQYLATTHPEHVYYTIISRFWELSAGGLLNYVRIGADSSILVRKTHAVRPVIGLSLIASPLHRDRVRHE